MASVYPFLNDYKVVSACLLKQGMFCSPPFEVIIWTWRTEVRQKIQVGGVRVTTCSLLLIQQWRES